VRKCLGVVIGVALLCLASWAQAPDFAPAQALAAMQTPAADPSQAPSTQAPDSTQNPPSSTQNPPSTQAPSSGQQQQQPEEATPLPNAPAPKPAPPVQYPRIEWSFGYSFAQAGFFNAGHWAQLNGFYASFGANAAPWLALVAEYSMYFGETPIPTGTPLPFPTCPPFCPQNAGPTFNASTLEYNILFGGQFPYRKYQTWTPFGELMVGHDGVRGAANGVSNVTQYETSSGLALLGGAGVDHKINERFAFRVKADYLQTRTDYPSLGKSKQDNVRFTVGVVIRSVKKKKRKLEDEVGVEQ
jgi:hypothetical protein